MDLKGLSLTYLSQELKIIFNGKYEMCYSEDDKKKMILNLGKTVESKFH